MMRDEPDGLLAGLARRHALSLEQISSLERLVGLLAADPTASTSVRDPRAIVRDHVADSLVALELPQVSSARIAADLGSGAGLPALPLAIARPDLAMSAVESVGRHAAFIARAAAECGVANLVVLDRRAEELEERERYDLVTARALAPLEVVAEYAAPLLRIDGALVAWRGHRDPGSEAAAAEAALELGLEVGKVVSVEPYPGVLHRHLHVLRKVAPTPSRFPRRPGMARKRPLGRRI